MSDYNESEIIIKDANGNQLNDGDSVTLTKDLKVKGSSINLKRGAVLKNIRLTDDEDHIEVRQGKTTMMIKVEFVKKK